MTLKVRFTALRLDFINGKDWELAEEFMYVTNAGFVVKVPAGFRTDFASIPRLFWRVIGPPAGEYAPAAVIHDYLYRTNKAPRKKADQLFREAMGALGVAWWKRTAMYYAVRAGGAIPYKNGGR